MNEKNKKIDRREFLRLMAAIGGMAALAPILEACERAGLETQSEPAVTHQPGATPTSIPPPTRKRRQARST